MIYQFQPLLLHIDDLHVDHLNVFLAMLDVDVVVAEMSRSPNVAKWSLLVTQAQATSTEQIQPQKGRVKLSLAVYSPYVSILDGVRH